MLKHPDELGAKSLPLVGTTGIIIGLILAVQSRPVLARFGAESYVPAMVSISVCYVSEPSGHMMVEKEERV
jgi:phospholipid/cholesterol/gamma-HCH transport system permease protein